jgi:hypothetical protein
VDVPVHPVHLDGVAVGGHPNSWRQFAIPAFSPVLLNLSFIFSALLLSDWFDPPVYAMAAGVVLGGIAQLAIQLPALARIGMLPRISLNLRAAYADPATRTLLGRMALAVLAVSAAQISLMINTHIASRLAAGSVSMDQFRRPADGVPDRAAGRCPGHGAAAQPVAGQQRGHEAPIGHCSTRAATGAGAGRALRTRTGPDGEPLTPDLSLWPVPDAGRTDDLTVIQATRWDCPA